MSSDAPLIQQAQDYLRQGNASEAWALLCSAGGEASADVFYFRAISADACGEHNDAAYALEACLRKEHKHPGALHHRGLMAMDKGDNRQAIEDLTQAITLAPEWAEAHYNLAVLLAKTGSNLAAEKNYQRALKINPDLFQAANNWANLMIIRGDYQTAERLLKELLKQHPRFPEAWCSLGRVHLLQEKFKEAEKACEKSIQLDNSFAVAWENLGEALEKQNQHEQALVAFQKSLSLVPDNSRLSFKCSALNGEQLEQPPTDYLRNLYDGMARQFDDRLVDKLGYRLPFDLPVYLHSILKDGAQLDVLDLGCGTGLVGTTLKPWTKRLVGVDLSSEMLALAAKRDVYDELFNASLQDVLKGLPASSWDLMIAADVFIYIGALGQVFSDVHRALKPGGHLLFSVELYNGDSDWVLNPCGRYAHSLEGLKKLANEQGCSIEFSREISLRKEQGMMLPGQVMLLKRGAK